MQVTIHLNALQRYKLYEKMLALGKGRPHWRRLRRLHEVLDCEMIEDVFERNRELRDSHAKAVAQAAIDRKAAPPAPDQVEFKVDDPTAPFVLEEGDLEYVHRKTREWDDEKDGPDSSEWRILLPLIDAIDEAWETVQKRSSKSNGSEAEVEAKTEAQDATA